MLNFRLTHSRHAAQNNLPLEAVSDSSANSLTCRNSVTDLGSDKERIVQLVTRLDRLLSTGGRLVRSFLSQEVSDFWCARSLSRRETGVRGLILCYGVSLSLEALILLITRHTLAPELSATMCNVPMTYNIHVFNFRGGGGDGPS